ncbi:uncharacterized protein LOC110855475 [Folsomia candida]|nr:uncharacterized protein LOC110855475 [Folsomia candida]
MGCLAPRLEQLSLAGKKVQQVVLGRASRVMALTMDGHVFHWVRDMYPVLIHKKNFDYQEVISLACTDDMYVALTSNGELFQHSSACPVSKWRPGRDLEPQKVILDSARVKKIVAISHIIFALTVEGTLYSGRVSQERKPVWGVVMKNLKFHDVAANAGSDDVVLAELKKNKVCLALSYRGGIFDPQVLSISSNVTLLDELFAEISSSTWRTIWADGEVEGGLMKPGKMGDDIGNLWGNKENVDVTFSVEGKTISAHKLILTSRSEYFAKMFSNEWKEAKSGSCIEIKDTKFEIFEALLFYIYQDKVKFAGDAYENIFGLMMLADAHCAVKIRRECEQILMRNINPENAVFLVRNAASANASNLESNVIRFILDNRLLNVGSSPQELIDLLGMDAFQKISVAGLRRL